MEIEIYFSKGLISVRTYNICKRNDLNTLFIIQEYLNKNKSFKKLRGCGLKSTYELIDLCNLSDDSIETEDINDILRSNVSEKEKSYDFESIVLPNKNGLNFLTGRFIKELGINEDTVENSEKLFQIQLYLKQLNIEFLSKLFPKILFPDTILDNLSVFSFIDFITVTDGFLNIEEKKLFQLYFTLNSESDQDYNVLKSNKFKQQRDALKLLNKISICFQIFQSIDDESIKEILYDSDGDFFVFTNQEFKYINEKNNTKFTADFVTYTFSLLKQDEFTLVGSINHFFSKRTINSEKLFYWKNNYLIKNDYFLLFSFDNFVNDLEEKLHNIRDNDFELYFKSYASRFLSSNDATILDKLLPLLEIILNNEFNMFLSLNDSILFKKKSNKFLYSIDTLDDVINAIRLKQSVFFENGRYEDLVPMQLKDIAFMIRKDLSTVSRTLLKKQFVLNNKLVPYKILFSDGSIKTITGNSVSQYEIMNKILFIINSEDKRKPLTDDSIMMILNEQGYIIARRTVAKYREEKLGILKSTLRKEKSNSNNIS
ncbi:RNA polymerase factor sigma-54 [Chryseobacterium oryzae]|uniref:RNA polymerase sigma factor 54 DNA-binding domain-containing protein n=1 Tax=Chryseobacterium oryzae TaxID=2929799 RepID=A0ABY4BJ16_9FLAO|nr:hypothetical protein [Chryseobacterium oryzae]UOE39162.1 hypothetical protein MTP08_05175 [Chryseobacterium oryzae]